MVVMILTLSIVTGFKHEVREKVIGYGAHIQIMKSGGGAIVESEALLMDSNIVAEMLTVEGVRAVHPVIYKPGIFQSGRDTTYFNLPNVRDTFQVQQEIKGVLFKGVRADYDWRFFEKHLKEGVMPDYSKEVSDQILVSVRTARQLNFQVGDVVSTYFIQQKPIKRNFVIAGLFSTGLEDFDKDIVLADLRMIQQYSGWGIQAGIHVADTLFKDRFLFEVQAVGGNGAFRFDWGKGYGVSSKLALAPQQDTVLTVVVSDYQFSAYEDNEEATIPDTALIAVRVKGNVYSGPPQLEDGKMKRQFLDEEGFVFRVPVGDGYFEFSRTDGKGSANRYISGYEVWVDDWNQLDRIDDLTKEALFVLAMDNGQRMEIRSIKEIYRDIFSWLGFLDINFAIIVVLMVAISIITMGAALLVLILEKTSTIGLLKALGATNGQIRSVFLYLASHLIVRGLIWGNAIGIGLALLQQYFQLIPLDPEVYYLNAVPIELNVWHLLWLNAGTLLVCIGTLWIPSWFITRITPVEALKYN
jgi:lipoprotein-releasing system permease protein